jgi:predicted O-methyltransferase YrrM
MWNDRPQTIGHSDICIRNLIYTMVMNTRPRRVLEIGTHIGSCAVVIAAGLKRNDHGKLLTLEPQQHYRDIASRYINEAGLADYVEMLPWPSTGEQCRARLAAEGPFEIVFVDGAHEYEAALFDIRLSVNLLADNGFVIMHDTGVRAQAFDKAGTGGVRHALREYAVEDPSCRVIFCELPIWRNANGTAILCKQRLEREFYPIAN